MLVELKGAWQAQRANERVRGTDCASRGKGEREEREIRGGGGRRGDRMTFVFYMLGIF